MAPELLHQVGRQTGLFDQAKRPLPVEEIVGTAGELPTMATAFSRNSRIAKVYCKVR